MPDHASSPVLAFLRSLAVLAPPVPRAKVPAATLLATAGLVFALLAASGSRVLGDPDSMWHATIGEWILTHRAFPTVDLWSHTVAGEPWIAKEWLSQVLFALAFRLAGWAGVVGLTAAVATAAVLVLAREAFARLPVLVAPLVLALVYMLMAGQILARPHALAWLPTVLWTLGLLHAAEEARAPRPALLLVMVAWANLHASWLFGLGVVPILALEALMRADPADRRGLALRWGLFGLAAALATLVHPYGWGTWKAAFSVIGIEGLQDSIMEWRPQSFAGFNPLEAVLLPVIALLATAGARIPLARLLLLLLLFHMALAHVRHTALLTLVGTLVAIEPIAARIGRQAAADVPPPPRALTIGALALALLVAATLPLRGIAPPRDNAPVEALAAARAAGVTGAVLNDYGFGGFLIARGVPTYIDGRTELYGGKRVALYRKAVSLQGLSAFDTVFSDPKIGWTMLATGMAAIDLLDRTPGWRRVYADDVAVVHARVAP